MKKFLRVAFVFAVALLLADECSALDFGRYYKAANARELSPIEWFILDETSDALLLIAKNCIDDQPYNEVRKNVTWENCTLRKWLNGEFFSVAFSPEEQAAIILADLPAGKDPRYSTDPGNSTRDKVFALNCDEVIKYMPREEDRQVSPISYARRRGAYTNAKGDCAWWTRSPGPDNTQASYLSSAGGFGSRAHYVDDDVIGVRPAVWVKKSFFDADTKDAAKILFSTKPDAQKAYEAENTLFPVMKQNAPFNVKELYDYFFGNPEKALREFDRKRFEVQGIVLRTGPDGVFGQPSVELSDKTGGKCFVLCVFQDAKSYSKVKPGDKISVRGNYLVIREDYGIVLKISELI